MNKRTKTPIQKDDIEQLNLLSKNLLNVPFEEGLRVVKEIKALMKKLDFSGSETIQAESLSMLGVFFGRSSFPQESQKYFTQVWKLVQKHSIASRMISAQANLAICKAQFGKYLEAIEIWKSLIAQDIDDNLRMNIMNNISVSCGNLGDYHQALDFAFQTLELAMCRQNEALWLSALMNLSTAYEKMGNYPKALDYIDQALALAKKTGDVRRECECLNNLSLILNELEEHETALKHAEDCLKLRKLYFTETDHATSYNNIGYIHESLGNFPEAIKNYKTALKLNADHGNQAFRANTIMNMVSIYLQQNELKQAEQYLAEAKTLLDLLGLKDLSMRYYSHISEIQARKGDFEAAYQNQKELNDILNNLYHDQLKHSINKNEAEYYRKRIEEQTEQYKTQNKELKKKNQIIRKNSKELNASYQSMQDTVEVLNWIVSVISHDVRAPLANFSRILEMMLNGDFPETESLEILHSIRKSSLNIYKLVDEMLDGIRLQRRKLDDSTNISLQDIIPHLQQIFMIYQPISAHKHLQLDFSYQQAKIFALLDSDLLKIVVRNLLNNAVKFTPEGGSILLNVSIAEKSVSITITDTGVGMHSRELKALLKRKKPVYAARETGAGIGLGWILCRDSIKKMKGSLEIQSEPGKGTTITITLPT